MKKLFLTLLLAAAAAAAVLNARYGAGAPYADLTGPPLLDAESLEVVLAYPEPVGNVAVSDDGRVFFTVHPESRPEGNRLLEWVDGAAVPYPSGAVQLALFDTVLGLDIDSRNRLWTIDHGNHGFGGARILAFDLASGDVVHDHRLGRDAAPVGSMLQDLRISADGRTAYIADASIWRQKPALIVYDVESRHARRILEAHPLVAAEDYLIRTPTRDMSFMGGLISLKAGVDGIALDAANDWLYFGAINHSGLFRVPVSVLDDQNLVDREVAARVERVTDKPLSDGLSMDADGKLYVTDVEHGAIHVVDTLGAGGRTTLVQSSAIRWADGLDLGPGGWLYIADSAIPDLVLRTAEQILAAGPYYVFRVRLATDESADGVD